MSLPVKWQHSLQSSRRTNRPSFRPFEANFVSFVSFVLKWWTWKLLPISIWPGPRMSSRPLSWLMMSKVLQRVGLNRDLPLGL
ncbi:hypothetical protein RHGRI_011311 [Rhododendron griersonianum]|uniref:Uncharacterized protein n=1 Tax=Rhododendron griersonianum TaxID=479676 RepID=A0AAV6KLW6_9ERIC|nr:hypothetical protein RHGRI_011311 [Rhododendron griersonianum]